MSEPNEVKQNGTESSNEASNVTEPTGSLGKRAVRGAVNGVENGIKRAWRAIPLKLRLIITGVGIVVILIFIFLMAIFNYALTTEKSDSAIKAADSYVSSSNFNSGETAKKNYDEKASLLLFKLKDVNGLYDETLKTARDSTKTDFSYVLGKNDIADDKLDKRVVDPDDKLPIYKHILLTEKYNFNKINWKIYGHEYNGEEIESVNKANVKMTQDTDLGIKYPAKGYNETDYKVDKFIDMTYPMLQNWYIPLAFLSASTTKGTENTANNPQLAYNIIKEAYSKIVVNRYDVQKYTLNTKYNTYDKVKKNNVLTVQVDVKTTTVQRLQGSTGNMKPMEVTKYIVAPSSSAQYPELTSAIGLKVERRTEHVNERKNDKGEEDPMKETLESDATKITSQYFVKEAKTFDVKIINEFNYIKYSEEDTKKRINSDTETVRDTSFTKPAEKTENDIQNIEHDTLEPNSSGENSVEALLKSKFPGKNITIKEVESLNTSNSQNISNSDISDRNGNIVAKQKVDVAPYKKYEVKIEDSYINYENCITHHITRTWEDKLSQIGSTNNPYTIDDLIEYNNSDDREKKVTAEELCGSSYSSSSSSNTSSNASTRTSTTEFTLNGKTYKVFGQQRGDSCSLCSILHASIAVKPSEYGNYDENKMMNKLNWTGPLFLSEIADKLTNTLNIPSKVHVLYKQSQGNKTEEIRKNEMDTARKEISNHLKTGNPVIILVKECQYAGMSINCHYTTLVGYDTDGKGVLCCDSAGGGLKVRFSNLDEALGCMFNYMDNPTEDGYVLVNYGQKNNTSSSANNSNNLPGFNVLPNTVNNFNGNSSSSSSNLSEVDKKLQEMLNYAVSDKLIGKIPYVWGGPTYGTKDELEHGGTDCGAFVYSLYRIFFNLTGGSHNAICSTSQNMSGDYGIKGSGEIAYDSSKGASQLKPGDILYSPGHATMYIGEYNGVPSVISQGGPDPGPEVQPLSKYNIQSYARLINNTSVTGVNGSVSSSSSSSSSSTVCNTEDGQYYKLYEKNKELNRIDFMNSNPGIYEKYLSGKPYSDYIGYPRAYLVFHYAELKRLFNKIQGKNGYLPFVYGQSLGFGTELTEGEGMSTDLNTGLGSGIEAMCQKAIELANENGGKGLWHYCQGSAGGATHEYARFSFSTIEEMEKYIKLAKEGKKTGTDCGAFVRSMYLAYTGVDIDPGGNGSGIISKGQSLNGKKLTNNSTITVHYNTLSDYSKLQPGDVLCIPGQHVGLYVGKIDGKHMQVDQGGSNSCGLCSINNGSSWKGPYYHEVSSSYTAYIHYEGLPSSGGASALLEESVFLMEGSTPTKTEKGVKYYQFVIGSEGNLAIGHGIDLDAGGYYQVFRDAGYNPAAGNWAPASFVDNLARKELNNMRNSIIKGTSGLKLTEYQISALVSRAYNCGYTGCMEGYGSINFVDGYKKYWKASDLKYKQKDAVDYNHPLYTQCMSTPIRSNGVVFPGLVTRREAEWRLFQTGYDQYIDKYY